MTQRKAPASFFSSQVWRDWKKCAKPKGEVWDKERALLARTQRVVAAGLECANRTYAHQAGVEPGDPRVLALEAEAASAVRRIDARSGQGAAELWALLPITRLTHSLAALQCLLAESAGSRAVQESAP